MGIGFGQVADIEFGFFPFDAFPHCKVKPKDVPSSIGVDSQKQVIFIIVDLDRTVEITSFEAWLENQLFL